MESAIITIAALTLFIDMKREREREEERVTFDRIYRIIHYRAINSTGYDIIYHII